MKKLLLPLLLLSSFCRAEDPEDYEKLRALTVSQKQLECIAQAMYFETNGHSRVYLLGVGNVVINRSLKSGKKPCKIIAKPSAFPWYTTKRDQMSDIPKDYLQTAFDLIIGRLSGTMRDVTNGATHFNQVKWGYQPNWTRTFPVTLSLPEMRFYKEKLRKGEDHVF